MSASRIPGRLSPFETAEGRRRRIALAFEHSEYVRTELVELLGEDRAADHLAALAKRTRRGRGRARGDTITRYDRELRLVYHLVRGVWRKSPDGIWTAHYPLARVLRLSRVKENELALEIAKRLGEKVWHRDLLDIFAHQHPEIFSSRQADSVARHIRSIVRRRRNPNSRIIDPPWPPTSVRAKPASQEESAPGVPRSGASIDVATAMLVDGLRQLAGEVTADTEGARVTFAFLILCAEMLERQAVSRATLPSETARPVAGGSQVGSPGTPAGPGDNPAPTLQRAMTEK